MGRCDQLKQLLKAIRFMINIFFACDLSSSKNLLAIWYTTHVNRLKLDVYFMQVNDSINKTNPRIVNGILRSNRFLRILYFIRLYSLNWQPSNKQRSFAWFQEFQINPFSFCDCVTSLLWYPNYFFFMVTPARVITVIAFCKGLSKLFWKINNKCFPF